MSDVRRELIASRRTTLRLWLSQLTGENARVNAIRIHAESYGGQVRFLKLALGSVLLSMMDSGQEGLMTLVKSTGAGRKKWDRIVQAETNFRKERLGESCCSIGTSLNSLVSYWVKSDEISYLDLFALFGMAPRKAIKTILEWHAVAGRDDPSSYESRAVEGAWLRGARKGDDEEFDFEELSRAIEKGIQRHSRARHVPDAAAKVVNDRLTGHCLHPAIAAEHVLRDEMLVGDLRPESVHRFDAFHRARYTTTPNHAGQRLLERETAEVDELITSVLHSAFYHLSAA